MIPSSNRFHGHSSLKIVYSKGRALRGPLFSLKFVPNSHRKNFRLAVVVSKKVSKSAVVRNRIRRRIYEVVRTGQLIIKPYDVVITVFSESVSSISSDELTVQLRNQFTQAGFESDPPQKNQ